MANDLGYITISRKTAGVLAVIFTVLTGLAAGLVVSKYQQRGAQHLKEQAGNGEDERTFRGTPGPWGDLEYVRINIERPDEFIAVDTGPIPESRWFFSKMTEEQVRKLFAETELSAPQREALHEKARWQQTTNGVYLTPGTPFILGLNPASRQKIYAVLAQFPENSFQHVPFTYRAGTVDEWFRDTGMAPATLAAARKLIYHRGQSVCFSDLPEVFSATQSLEERRLLLKTLSRQMTLLMKLRVKADTNIDQLVQYWGRSGRAKDIRPLLESLAKVPGGASLDISHLLSSFARARLYTFPMPDRDEAASRRDCFWTSMNFFNAVPDDQFFEYANTRRVIEANYTSPIGAPAYGDLIFIYNPHGDIVHAAIYIADDVVFTKNGAHFNQPWILMKMDDLMSEYPTETPYKVAIFRPKNS